MGVDDANTCLHTWVLASRTQRAAKWAPTVSLPFSALGLCALTAVGLVDVARSPLGNEAWRRGFGDLM